MQECRIIKNVNCDELVDTALKGILPRDIRTIDLVELLDLAAFVDIDTLELVNNLNLFENTLRSGLGLHGNPSNILFTRDGKPVFLATCIGDGTLNGVGWQEQDKLTNLYERKKILMDSIHHLVICSKLNQFRCYVSQDNQDTLKSWEKIKRIYKNLLRVVKHPIPNSNFILVTIEKV